MRLRISIVLCICMSMFGYAERPLQHHNMPERHHEHGRFVASPVLQPRPVHQQSFNEVSLLAVAMMAGGASMVGLDAYSGRSVAWEHAGLIIAGAILLDVNERCRARARLGFVRR